MTVGKICSREVAIAFPNDSVQEAARIMREQHVGDVVVVEEEAGLRKPVGLLTDRDIVVEVVAKSVDAAAITVADAMSADLLVAHEEDSIGDTLRRMRARGVRRAPVIDGRGGLVGIVASDDIVALIAEELGEIAKLVARQPRQEAILRRA